MDEFDIFLKNLNVNNVPDEEFRDKFIPLKTHKIRPITKMKPPLSLLCKICEKEKTIDHFHKSKTCRFGVLPYCKECKRVSNRKYYEGHSKEIINNVIRRGIARKSKIISTKPPTR